MFVLSKLIKATIPYLKVKFEIKIVYMLWAVILIKIETWNMIIVEFDLEKYQKWNINKVESCWI